jgi:TetR/AcrR family transcriptional regulator, acrAB operon repressor
MRKTKEEAAVTREKLLHVALSVFSTKGYSATRLEDIAREAGVTRGAVYWHFHGGKAELYNSLLREYSTGSGTIIQQAVKEGGTFKDILRKIFMRLLSAVEDNKELRAVMEIALFKTESTDELKTSRRKQIEDSRALLAGITEAMRQGIASGELRSDIEPAEMARAFMAFQNGAIYLWLWDQGSFSLKISAETLADIFLAGVSSRG